MGNLLAAFKLFGVGHFVYLFISIAVCISLVLFLRKTREEKRNLIRIILLSVGGVFILLEFIGRIVGTPKYNFFNNMPFELFQIFYGILIFIFISKSTGWSKFAYFSMVPVCAYSLIFMPYYYEMFAGFSLAIIGFVFSNIVIITYAILDIIWKEFYLEKRDVINSVINFLIILAIQHILNVFIRFTALGVNLNLAGTMAEEYDLILNLLTKIIPIPFVVNLPLCAILVGVEFLLLIPFKVVNANRENKGRLDELVALGNMKAQKEHREKHSKKGASQILVRSENKATPTSFQSTHIGKKDGFVSVTKQVKVNNETKKD